MIEITSTTTDADQISTLCKQPRHKRQASPGTPCTATKLALASKLLRRARGASIAELGTATGWQAHSVRALLSGLRKKGVRLARETRKSGEGCYRIVANDAVGISSTAVPAPTVAVA